MANQNQNQGNSNRGFASMDEDKQREIAAKHGYELEEHSLVLYVRKKR